MAAASIPVLENIISTAVNTQYKEVPPTEEEFLSLAGQMRTSMAMMYSVSDEEFNEILLRLRTYLVIQMDVGVFINDRNTPHRSWLPARKADLDFFFWNRYKRYLEEQKHWNPRVTATLDKVSDEIVDLLADPVRGVPMQRRGLVLGDVQSGKTANYTAICNKAADAGYRIIIVLAGIMENLRQQTQSRLDMEFSGRKSEYYLDPKMEQEIKNVAVGVGRYGTQKRIASFTSVTKDFDSNILRSNDLNLQSVQDTIVLVVKKNKRILTNLAKWLAKSKDPQTGTIRLPMLLIDDEADNASVNTKNEDENPAAINACIRKLLKLFECASYVGITATPFANIFINPESETDMQGEDLFPRDFIYALSPPTNYIGADKVFGEEGKFADCLIPLKNEEMDHFFPFTHKKDLVVNELPPSLYEAMGYFLLFNAIRDYRGDNAEHRSMMIHISRFTAVQNRIAEVVNEWMVQVSSDVRNYAALSDERSDKIDSIRYLHAVWDKHHLESAAKISWTELRKKYLYRAVAPIVVRAVNQKTGATSLDYFNHKEDGLRVIAVGGNSLSRGLTLEGLGVSYFYRKSQMYDTLLQMGRWFGYRPNYEDLFRIWMAEEAIDWYGYITRAANELKGEIAKMKFANQTPMEFGLKVRQDPNSLIATARNKMRTARSVSRPVTVSGKLLETPRLKSNAGILETNKQVVLEFIRELAYSAKRDADVTDNYYWRGLDKQRVAQLLLDFETHPWHLAFQGRALSEYIQEKMDDTPWDVALIASGSGPAYPDPISYGNGVLYVEHTAKRKLHVKEKSILISGTKVRVGSGGCTKIGLTQDEIKIAEKRFKERNSGNPSDSAYLIKERKPLLMIHIVSGEVTQRDTDAVDVPDFLFALGVGFPDTGEGVKTANYVVNMIELQNWIDIDEDEDE